MKITFDLRIFAVLESIVVVIALLYATTLNAAVLTFDDPSTDFTFDGMGAYQPSPYDGPDDGADQLAQHTSSEWVGLNSNDNASGSVLWDGGLEGGNNTLLNLLLSETFDLASFVIAGVYGSQTVTVQGLDDGALLYSELFAIDLTPRLFLAGWTAIDELRIVVGDDFVVHPDHLEAAAFRNWAIDDVQYNLAAIPVPGAGLLFLSGGLPLLAALPRRRRHKAAGAE